LCPDKTPRDITNISSTNFKSIHINNENLLKPEILRASETGLINSSLNSNLALIPKLIVNDYSKGSKVLTEIISELNKCTEFLISVSFITSSGVTPLLETFKQLASGSFLPH
jgi:HKD family nuclease